MGANNSRTDFFNTLESWFFKQKSQIEKEWSDLIEKYKDETHLGKIVYFQMGRAGRSRIDSRVTEYLDIPFSWNDSEYTFYFNSIHADLSTEEFNRQKLRVQSILGEPDNVIDDSWIVLPSWSNGIITIKFRHVDTHGNGYEKVEIEIDRDYLLNSKVTHNTYEPPASQ